MNTMQEVSRRSISYAGRVAARMLLIALCGAATTSYAASTAAKPQQTEHIEDAEIDTDPAQAERAGFKVLNLERGDDGSLAARIIEKEILPGLVKQLPWPAAGFRYALTDLDGDGAPELFLVIKHYTLCEAGCPIRIYKFRDGTWHLLLARTTIMTAIRPPVAKGDKPRVAFMTNGPDALGPTETEFYTLIGDKLAPTAAKKQK